MGRQIYILAFLLLTSTFAFGQVEFKAKPGKSKLGANERLRIDFEMNEDGDNFQAPDFKGFKVTGGPSQSISQSWVNGKKSFKKTYTYYLEPEKRGTFTIGQATVSIDGKTYKTSPVEIEVTESVDQPKDGDGEEIMDVTEDIHVVTEVSKTNPYFNEGFLVEYRLYVSPDVSITDWGIKDNPDFSNFWSHDIDVDFSVQNGSYKGEENYRYVVLKKAVLYPQKEGELKLEPMTLNFRVEVPTNKRDWFGQPVYKPVEKSISSESREIDVKSLPEEGKPADFTGAVGQFDFDVKAAKDSVETEESIDVEVVASGTGNLKLFSLPELEVPKSFEAYDPEHVENINVGANNLQGNIKDTYTLIPNAKGDYTISGMNFSYFDPQTESYKTLSSDEIKIKVVQGPESAVSSSSSLQDSTASSHKSIVSADDHFKFIKTKTNLHAIDKSPFFKSGLFWFLLLSPIVLLPILIGVGKKQKEKMNDLYGNRKKRASRLARKYLSEAQKAMGNDKAYYNALERALYNYLRATIDIQPAEMTKVKIAQSLQGKGVTQETGTAFIKLLESCELARYTPHTDEGMQQDYDKAAEVIAAVDKQIKKK